MTERINDPEDEGTGRKRSGYEGRAAGEERITHIIGDLLGIAADTSLTDDQRQERTKVVLTNNGVNSKEDFVKLLESTMTRQRDDLGTDD